MKTAMERFEAVISYIHNGWLSSGDAFDELCDLAKSFAQELMALRAVADREGDNAPCYYCGEPCEALAGNPSRWPIPLCHRDDPGHVKWHHEGCVTSRLIENQPASPTPPAAWQEPIAWMFSNEEGDDDFGNNIQALKDKSYNGGPIVPLFLHKEPTPEEGK